MTSNQIQHIIQQGESKTVEFKTCKNKLNKDAFDSICAFLNRSGGYLLLGVKDNGEITGVDEEAIQGILDTIVTSANNPQKLNPPYYLSPNVIEIESKKVIVNYIPESSQVHYTAGKIYDRNEDGDFDITNQSDQVTQLFLRKQSTYTENQVFPYVELSDFKESLFDRVRALARNQRKNHPWAELSNKELLKSAGLYKKDFQTGKSGYTLAAVLLFGTEQLIQSVLPHHRTDAIQRVINLDRYDDRDDIRVNLIDSYDRLTNFISKHLPDKFHLDGDQRISLRDNLFREIIGNLLIHREFTNGFPAKLIIGKNSVTTENWNKPHGSGNIDPNNFSPHPKNPMIAKFFKQIGWVDELGSGVRNTYKFCKLYTPNSTPEFIEGDIFKAIIPISQTIEIAEKENEGVIEGVIEGVTEGVTEGVKEKLVELLTLLINEEGNRKPHYAEILNESEKNLERYFKILSPFIEFKGAPKTGGYYLTEILKEKLSKG
jgi:ATP-dependent DNA helicase RecG